ncbi:MAG: hypothetical protein AVDCRST_MAG10-165, partial [uncultured Acidimicrobiales bacterium]
WADHGTESPSRQRFPAGRELKTSTQIRSVTSTTELSRGSTSMMAPARCSGFGPTRWSGSSASG